MKLTYMGKPYGVMFPSRTLEEYLEAQHYKSAHNFGIVLSCVVATVLVVSTIYLMLSL